MERYINRIPYDIGKKITDYLNKKYLIMVIVFKNGIVINKERIKFTWSPNTDTSGYLYLKYDWYKIGNIWQKNIEFSNYGYKFINIKDEGKKIIKEIMDGIDNPKDYYCIEITENIIDMEDL